MKLLSSLRKPAWQSADAARRAAAVESGHDPDLIAALPAIATGDADADVRKRALRRCDDPVLYARAMNGDADAGLRTWARRQWFAAALGGRTDIGDEALDRLDVAECEQLAAGAISADLRRRALARVRRPGFIAERALADADPALRLALIERIDSTATLARIADQARKTDKHLARRARERLDTLRLAIGDIDARRQRAEQLCAELELAMREPGDTDALSARLERLDAAWRELGPEDLPPALQARQRGAREVLAALLAGPVIVPEAPVAVAEPEAPTAPTPSPEEIAAQVRLQAELAANAAEHARERAIAEAQQREQDARRLAQEQRLDRAIERIDAGDLHAARTLLAEIDLTQLSGAARRRWQAIEPKLKSLSDWQHWANNKVRARLCEEIEALAGSGAHPDAIANRIRDLQHEWRQLDALEGRAADASQTGLDRRFRAVCARALKPAKGYFEKRDALRGERRAELEKFLADAATVAGGDDTPAMLALQQEAAARLRSLGELAPSDRKTLGKQLRDLLDALRPRLETAFSEAESARERLIAAAEALGAGGDLKQVAGEAKTLMQRWKSLGKGRPGRDQQQWRRFRGALDRIYANLDARREQTQTEQRQRGEQAEAVVAELEALANAAGDALSAGEPRVRALRDLWRELAVRETGLADRYDAALSRHRDAMRQHRRDKLRDRYLAELDAGGTIASPSQVDTAGAQALIFEAEALAGIDPPADEREARRRWQLARLQDHMRGERGTAAEDGVDALIARWRALGELPAADRARYKARLARAIESIVAAL